MKRTLATLLLAPLAACMLIGCAVKPNRVVVLGMIHGGHRTSDVYSLDVLRRAIKGINPDVVLTEIPPDRFDKAKRQFERTGEITEARVSRFPEYVDVLFPLTKEMDFEIVPCAGWTEAMADDRRVKLEKWAETRPGETAEVEAAQQRAEAEMKAEFGDADDPRAIHTARYDELVRQALEPYDRLFNDDLGPGGWTNINEAHIALIEQALDVHAGRDETILIMFGAWHKYMILDRLREREDIEIIDARPFFQ